MTHIIFKNILLSVIILVLGIIALNTVASAHENTKLTTGLFYVDGQSDTINKDNVLSTSVPLELSIKNEKLSFGVSMAYLSVKSGTFKESGLGDTIISLGYDLTHQFSVKLKQKIATGDANKGLSTGKDDVSVQLDYFTSLNNKVSLFTTLGYKKVGKVEELNMQDSLYASVGTGHIFSNKTRIGVSLDYKESIFKNLENQLGVAAFVSKPLNSNYSLTGFAGYDLTKTKSIGVSLTTQF